MTETFFIGDTHFGHKNIIVFEQTRQYRQFATIQEHDEELIRRWNSVVGPNDTVYHLGDVAFGKTNLEKVGRLNGRKYLVLGNHDQYPMDLYLKHFKRVSGAFACYGFLLTHVPVHPDQLSRAHWDSGNIHGHLHTNWVQMECLDEIREFNHMSNSYTSRIERRRIPDRRFINVACEQVDLTPVHLDVIRKFRKGEVTWLSSMKT